MKRWFLLLSMLLAIALLMSGCVGRHPDNTAHPVTYGFSCSAVIQYHELELQSQLSRESGGKLQLAFSAPKSLKGVVLGWDGESMTMKLGGMSVAVPTERVPQGALIQRILQVLAATPADGTVTDEGYVMSGTVDELAYTLVCDPQTGLPRSLSVPSEELEAVFSDCVPLTQTTL
jgi:hypothetical protein